MNPSTATATVLVDELVRCGVTEVVLCPGSRSAPLAYAVQAADRDGRLRMHVRVDERSAGFLALGLAKVSRRPAVVVTTSGTAAANLHPAVLEAHHGQVPMIVLTADRPAELRGAGANQTTVQPGLYGRAVRWQVDLPAAHGLVGEQRAWRTAVDRGWAAATGCSGPWGVGEAGPVHLNVGFRDPLLPDLRPTAADRWPEPLAGRPDGRPWTASATSASRVGSFTGAAVPEAIRRIPVSGADDPVEDRTLMVLGDLPDPTMAAPALRFAELHGWPVVAEPFGAGDRGRVLPHGPLVLAAADWLEEHLPARVLVVGRVTLNREVAGLLRHAGVRVEAVSAASDWADPGHLLAEVHPWTELVAAVAEAEDEVATWGARRPVDGTWAQAWQGVAAAVAGAVGPVIEQSWPSGVAVARTVLTELGPHDILVAGSSNPARDLHLAHGGDLTATVVSNRGLAGIDGTVSTAVGVALSASAGPGHRPSEGRVVALMGDLTFVHDSNGLLIGPDEPGADLTLVVVNDDGGGIFHTLEYGDPARAGDFERVFGTPTGTDVAAVCRAHHVGHTVASSPEDLTKALTRAPDGEASGIRVVEVAVPRAAHRELRDRLRQVAVEAAAALQR